MQGVKALVIFIRDSELRDEAGDIPIMDLLQMDEKLAFDDDIVALINTFWKTPVAQKAFSRKNLFQLQDCFSYFADSLQAYPTWGGPQWVPTEEECVRARVRTSGIIEESFEYKNVTFRLYDAGGQRAERRKWIVRFVFRLLIPELTLQFFAALL